MGSTAFTLTSGADSSALGRAATRGPFVGALVVTGLTLRPLVTSPAFSAAPGMRIAALAASLAYGIVLGLAAELAAHSKASTRARGLLFVAIERAVLVVALHGALLFHAMATWPTVFAEEWYARGGIARTVQIVATDVLGPTGVVVAGVVFVVGYVGPIRIAVAARSAARRARMTARSVAKRASRRAIMLLGFAAAASVVGDAPARAGDLANAPNVVVVIVDSLRADALDPRIAPNMAALAARGIRFDRAYATIPSWLPAWVTLLTGREPDEHGIRTAAAHHATLDALPARFASAGYTTTMLADPTSHTALASVDLGLPSTPRAATDARLDALEALTPLLPVLHADISARLFPALRTRTRPRALPHDALSSLTRATRSGPVFAAVALAGASYPFAARSPYYARFTDRHYRGRFKYDAAGLHEGAPVDARDRSQVRALYEGSVAAVDDAVGGLLRSLDDADRPTVVVLIGARGESLAAAPRLGDAETRVPFVVMDPRGGRKGSVSEVVRDVDLAPTLLELAGLAPLANTARRSLVDALQGKPLPPKPAMSEGAAGEDVSGGLVERPMAIRDEHFELVYTPERRGALYALYELGADPDEDRDVSADHPAELARLRDALWSWMIRDPAMERRGGFLVPRQVARPRSGVAREVSARLADPESAPRVTLGGETRTVLPQTDVGRPFTIDAPREAKLTFAEGARSTEGATFVVSLRTGDAWRELYRHRTTTPDRWADASIDLSAYAGTSVDLRFVSDGNGYWGDPRVLREGRAPRNVLWVAVDGLPPDLDALPHIAALAKDGARFTNAHASGLSRFAGTAALLAGARPSELVTMPATFSMVEAALAPPRAPLAPVTIAQSRIETRAFVERARSGAEADRPLDRPFESVVDGDPDEVTGAARAWIADRADASFCAFVHYGRSSTRAKVDENVGTLVSTLVDLGLRDETVIVVSGTSPPADSADVATRVPLVIVAPRIVPRSTEVTAPVRTVDVAPTLLDLLDLEPHARTSGTSLSPLLAGHMEPPRVLLAEGPGLRVIEHESFRFVARYGPSLSPTRVELFDTRTTPSRDVSSARPDVVAEMRARLDAALANVAVASAPTSPDPSNVPKALVRLRFAGGGASRRVAGSISFGDARAYRIRPVELAADAVRDAHGKVDIAFRTSARTLVGLDIEIEPPTAAIHWTWWLDDAPWSPSDVFAGPFELAAPRLASGVETEEARRLADAPAPPLPKAMPELAAEVGLFVTREAPRMHVIAR